MPKLHLDRMKWSFSRVSSYEQCPLGWWNSYFYKINREVGNAFSDYGTLCHDIISRQMTYKMNGCNLMTNEFMKNEFQNSFYMMRWGKFPHGSKQKISYLYDGISYFSNWDSFDGYEVKLVEHFGDFRLGGYNCNGGLDLLLEKDGELYLVDHKSSKPYDDEEMSSKIKQLYFYGPLVASIFGKFPDYVGFNFIRKNSLKFDKWDMAKFKESTEWFKDGIKQIEETKIFVEKPDYFFCNNICNHRLTCTKKASMKEKKKEVVEDFEGYE